ncbi:MAG: Smr/MutS family protein [Alphaproteobacteria bacterium]|nr:Smr/MutS family protein [Alphaproteobacteria bacterium]
MSKKKDHLSKNKSLKKVDSREDFFDLKEDEASVWEEFTKDIKKLPKTASSADLIQGLKDKGFKDKLEALTHTVFSKNQDRPLIAPSRAAPVFNEGMTRRTIRKLVPEATIDLHGYTLQNGRLAFRKFVQQQANLGRSCICIITGKGTREQEEDKFLMLLAYESAGKRTLREALHDWAKESDIHPLIASLSRANPNHGGDGAYYLVLKKIF